MKKFFKKFSLFLFVILICSVLGGCSAEYNITIKENGLIETSVSVDLTGLESDKKEKVIAGFREYFNKFGQLDRKFEENTIELYSNIYNLEDIKIKEEKVAYILSRNGYIVNDSEVKVNETRTKLTYSKSFYSLGGSLSRSLTAYYLYFYPSALAYDEQLDDIVLSKSYINLMDDIPLSSTLEKDESAFMAKYIQTCNPLYYNGKEPEFLYSCSNSIISVEAGTTIRQFLNDIGISNQQLDILFNFSTPYERVHSNGNIVKNHNGFTHSWQLNDVDSSVTFYRNISRPMWWYIICAGIGIIIIIVGLTIGYVLKNHKKKVGMDALKKIDELANKK